MSKNDNTKIWGEPTWHLIHTLAYKLKDEYESEVPILANKLKQLCKNLPCPDCAQHATYVLNSSNINTISKKKDLELFMFEFHNIINLKLSKNNFDYSELNKKYSKMSLVTVIQTFFFNINKRRNRSNIGMLLNMHINNFYRSFAKYLKSNLFKFNV
tara:strand:+ start:485 stop:955 length:471 start_codon:yes stop_codon:yes gene_type:complete